MDGIAFTKVLELFESHGWKLQEGWGNYRVFVNPSDKESLPWLIPVNDRKVSMEYYSKIQEFFENETKSP